MIKTNSNYLKNVNVLAINIINQLQVRNIEYREQHHNLVIYK